MAHPYNSENRNVAKMALKHPYWQSVGLLFAIAANMAVFVTVNYWIYRVHFLFAARNPEYVARKLATISQSISDPAVGEPFAVWISMSAPLLVVAVIPIIWLHLRAANEIRSLSPMRFRLICALAVIGGISQIVAAIGMTILSQYRFPDFNQTHMTGSYLFFGFQALAVLSSTIASYILASGKGFAARLAKSTTLRPEMNRWRWRFGAFCLAMTITYVGLFWAKDHALAALRHPIYISYIYLEPMVITGFLAYLALFCTDLWRAAVSPRN